MSDSGIKSVTLTKEEVLSMISEEKELFFRYKQICNSYDVPLDNIVERIHRDRINSLNVLISMMRSRKGQVSE